MRQAEPAAAPPGFGQRVAAHPLARAFARRPGLCSGVALLMLSAFAYAPLLGGGMILTGDTAHVLRVYEMTRCLDDGQFPCRWVPDMGKGYGYPLFNYYPPLPYYAGDLLHRVGFSYLRTVDLLYVLGLVGAGLAMFTLARRLWGNLGGLVSAVAYVYAPYLALDIFMRGALAELWALAFVPALLWAVHELITTERPRFAFAIALTLAGLLLSHNLVAVIAAPAVLLWTVVLLLTRGRRLWRPALLGSAGAALGFGLAAFFTLPVLREGDLVQLDSLTRRPFDYGSHFVSVRDLFLLRSSDYSFLLGGRDGPPSQIGWYQWALAGLALPAVPFLLWTRRVTPALAALMFVVFFGVGVFMAVSRSQFIWDAFDSLRYLQFPWRYLGLVSIGAAGLAGAWLALLRSRPVWLQLLVAGALIGVLIGTGRGFFHTLVRFQVSDAKAIAGGPFATGEGDSNRDYLPRQVTVMPDRARSPARVTSGSARILETDAGTDWLDLRVEATEATQLEVALYYFPTWRVEVDGQRVPALVSRPHGLVSVVMPPGEHQVELWLEDTRIRRLGNRISLAAWAALVLAVPAAALMPYVRRGVGRVWPGRLRLRYRTPGPAVSGPEGR